MGPAVDIHPPFKLEDEPLAKKMKPIKTMTGTEWTILTKVFYEVRRRDVQKSDSASPTDHSKAHGQLARSPLVFSMEASPSFSTMSVSSSIGTNSTIPVTPTNSPTASFRGQNIEEEVLLKRKAEQDELTKRLWQKYPAVMQALEQPSIMDKIVNEAPRKKTSTASPKVPTKKTPAKKRTPQKRRACKKGTPAITNEYANFDVYVGAPYMKHLHYEAVPKAYSWPSYSYFHPSNPAAPYHCGQPEGVAGHVASPFYPLPYPQPFDPLPSVDTLLPNPSFPSSDPLPVLDLSSDDLDYFYFGCSPPSL